MTTQDIPTVDVSDDPQPPDYCPRCGRALDEADYKLGQDADEAEITLGFIVTCVGDYEEGCGWEGWIETTVEVPEET